MQLFLCSYLYKVREYLKEFLFHQRHIEKLGFIATASDVEEYKKHIERAREVFAELGIETIELDISGLKSKEVITLMDDLLCIYVAGGNTFYLLQELKKKGFVEYIRKRVESGLIYIGESAGAMLTAKNIEYVKFLDDAGIANELKYTDSLSLVDFYILPHYLEYPFEESTSKTMIKYKGRLKLLPISNKEDVWVDEDKVRMLGR